jgi:hypothetical protein
MIKYCKGCGEQIHPKRVEILPKTQTCVNCSGSEKKGAINVMRGEGDHTYVETIILEADEYRRLKEAEDQLNKKPVQLEKLYFDSDDSESVSEDVVLPNLPDGFHEVNLNDSEYE